MKQMMRASGMTPLRDDQRRDDPFFAHFPELKGMLAAAAYGRRSGELRKGANDPKIFQSWETRMRYAPTADIKIAWVDEWRESAAELINRMETE